MADGAEGSRTAAEIESAERKAKAEADLAEQNARIKRIEADKAEGLAAATTRQSVTEANVATVKALYPKGETKPLEGTTTRDDKSGFLGELVANHAMRSCVSEIASRVNERFKALKPTGQDAKGAPGSPRVLLVRDMNQLSRGLGRVQFSYQLQQYLAAIATAHETMAVLFRPPQDEEAEAGGESTERPASEDTRWLDIIWTRGITATAAVPAAAIAAILAGGAAPAVPPVVTGLLAAGSALSLAADAAAFLQTDYDIRGRDTTIEPTSVELALAGEIEAFVIIDGFAFLDESPLLELFAEAVALRDGAEAEFQFVKLKFDRASELKAKLPALRQAITLSSSSEKRAKLQLELAAAEAEYAELLPHVPLADREIVRWQALRPQFDGWVVSALSPVSGGQSPLHAAALAQFIQDSAITHLLSVSATESGAETVTARHRLIFWKNGWAKHTAGASVAFVLAQTNGIVVLADTITRVEHLNHQFWDNKSEPGDVSPAWFSEPRPRSGQKWTLPG